MKTVSPRFHRSVLAILALLLSGMPLVHAQNVGINTTDPKSTLDVDGSLGLAVSTVTATTTLTTATKSLVVCNNGGTNIMVTLPLVADCPGRMFTIKKGTGSTGSVHIMGASSQTIDGYSAYMLMNKDESVTIFSNGTGSEWKTISKSNEPFPMGEINYFSVAGTTINIVAQSDGSTNMLACAPATTLSSGAMDFDMPANGQLRYTGDRPKHFHIACTISMKAAATQSDTFVFGIAKITPPSTVTILTASKVLQEFKDVSSSTALHVAIEMNKNEYLQFYVGNTTSATRDVTIQALTLFALGMD